jgi:hypothetical protein
MEGGDTTETRISVTNSDRDGEASKNSNIDPEKADDSVLDSKNKLDFDGDKDEDLLEMTEEQKLRDAEIEKRRREILRREEAAKERRQSTVDKLEKLRQRKTSVRKMGVQRVQSDEN